MTQEEKQIRVNPKSLENLIPGGKPTQYDEPRKRRSPNVTDTGWDGSNKVLKALGYDSISSFLELLGRGDVSVPPAPKKD